MQFYKVTDTHTGRIHNALAMDVAGAQRQQGLVAASAKGSFWDYRIIDGDRYQVDGVAFDVELTRRADADAATQVQQTSRASQTSSVAGYEYDRLVSDLGRRGADAMRRAMQG